MAENPTDSPDRPTEGSSCDTAPRMNPIYVALDTPDLEYAISLA